MKPSHAILAAAVLATSLFGAASAQPAPDGAAGADGGSPPGAGRGALRAACQADITRLCADVEAAGGHVIQCVRQHPDELSDACRSALATMHARHQWGQPPASTAPPATSP